MKKNRKKQKKKVYVLGNPLLKDDNIALKILPELKKTIPSTTFEIYDPTENLPEDTLNCCFIDVVQGIEEVKVFEDIERFVLSPSISVHDYDLPIDLQILKKIGKIKKMKIIGIPQKGNKEKIIRKIKKILKHMQ